MYGTTVLTQIFFTKTALEHTSAERFETLSARSFESVLREELEIGWFPFGWCPLVRIGSTEIFREES